MSKSTFVLRGMLVRSKNILCEFITNILSEIKKTLHQIKSENGVKILLAMESGIRVWGLESLVSDYDCRFVFVRHIDDLSDYI